MSQPAIPEITWHLECNAAEQYRMRAVLKKYKKILMNNYILIVVVLAFVGVFGSYFSNFNNGFSDTQGTWGEFGDFVGGTLNPILGFLTVIILITTLRVQQKELKDAREAATKNGDLIGSQIGLMEQQAIQNTFFKLLEDFNKDPVVLKCKSPGKVSAIFLALYTIKDMPIDSAESAEIFSEMVEDVSLGEFRYVVIEKLVMLVVVALKLRDKIMHLKLLQTSTGVALASCIVHHSKFADVHFKVLKKGAEVLRGVNFSYVYDVDVAKAFMTEDGYIKYLSNRESIIEGLEDAVSKYRASKGGDV